MIMIRRIQVMAYERAVVFRNGRIARVLDAGAH